MVRSASDPDTPGLGTPADRRPLPLSALEPVDRPGPLRVRVYEALAELIADGDLKPGDHLVETELATRLHVSRQPVREAIQQLHYDGWVDQRPARGAFVHQPRAAEVDQVFVVRAALEAEGARLAASRVTEADLARLRELCEAGMSALEADDANEVVALNARLHAAITRIAGNELLAGLLVQLDRRIRWYFTLLARSRGRQAWTEHTVLIDALEAGDGERAAQIMRSHVEASHVGYRHAQDRTGEEPASEAGP
ncbi:MAG TPA: GntR family transcriptional regulator [Acidimicrobiales bacterium]|nr:GntR family transcriptional regulator [Acidimicrobiales bacterium]